MALKFGSKFIIETHSEHLIKGLQILTAKHYLKPDLKREIHPSLSTDDSVIYYFNDVKYVNENEPKIVKIEITENGNLTDTFFKGFFDSKGFSEAA